MKAKQRTGITLRTSQQHTSAERIEELADLLRERRRRVQERLAGLFWRLREEAQPAIGDDGGRAISSLLRDLGSARLDQFTQIRRQIDAALDRHAAGWYGWCLACGAEIPIVRLCSLPLAHYCRACQIRAEERCARAVCPNA